MAPVLTGGRDREREEEGPGSGVEAEGTPGTAAGTGAEEGAGEDALGFAPLEGAWVTLRGKGFEGEGTGAAGRWMGWDPPAACLLSPSFRYPVLSPTMQGSPRISVLPGPETSACAFPGPGERPGFTQGQPSSGPGPPCVPWASVDASIASHTLTAAPRRRGSSLAGRPRLSPEPVSPRRRRPLRPLPRTPMSLTSTCSSGSQPGLRGVKCIKRGAGVPPLLLVPRKSPSGLEGFFLSPCGAPGVVSCCCPTVPLLATSPGILRGSEARPLPRGDPWSWAPAGAGPAWPRSGGSGFPCPDLCPVQPLTLDLECRIGLTASA